MTLLNYFIDLLLIPILIFLISLLYKEKSFDIFSLPINQYKTITYCSVVAYLKLHILFSCGANFWKVIFNFAMSKKL